MTEKMRFVQVENPRGIALVHALAARHIPGYGGEEFDPEAENAEKAARLDRLFEGHGPVPESSVVLAATNASGSAAFGAAIVETPCSEQLVATDPERARSLARMHRILSALFVPEEERSQGLGTVLLREQAAWHTLCAGARYLDGFVDDQTGSVDFYRQVGATVMDHNVGLPARRPTNTPLELPSGVNGHWFFFDVWPMFEGPLLRCSRCGNQLTFDPADGGDLACSTCGPPPLTEEHDAPPPSVSQRSVPCTRSASPSCGRSA